MTEQPSAASSPEFGTSGTEKSERTEQPAAYLKRFLRLVVLGPIYVVAGTACVLVLPFLFFLWWLMGDDLRERWEIVKEVASDGKREVWNGYAD